MINKTNGLLFLLGCLVGMCIEVGELCIKSLGQKAAPQIIQLGKVGTSVNFEFDNDSLYKADSSLDYLSDGCIDTPQLAAYIGIAYLCDIYGAEQIKGELPFDVVEFQKSWLVEGNLPKGHYGGVASIYIRKKDGMVIRYTHDE